MTDDSDILANRVVHEMQGHNNTNTIMIHRVTDRPDKKYEVECISCGLVIDTLQGWAEPVHVEHAS